MSLQNRNTLKNFFRKGQMPSEVHFTDLIDSVVNKVDDGLTKTLDDGLMLSPMGASKKLLSFFKSIEDKNPAWSVEIDSGNANLDFNNHLGESVLSLQIDGNVGVQTRTPQYELDVNGFIGSKGRLGTYKKGKVLGDGKWHPILSDLTGCHSFEVSAGIGKKKTGKYALIHANAISTFGKSRPKITINQGYYGTRCNKIEMRWTGTTYAYQLEMRTRCNYEGEYYIQYYIASLWNDETMENSLGIDGIE
ncbi:MAG: adhesin [Cytophagia bacterium]|nr:MAG: adhesin [Cytophagales bacterium]TAG05199.1 MAG: adhesin [Cytophagia bacterium]TAG43811.1 MAG: adhesin [Cytophagia bacterium]